MRHALVGCHHQTAAQASGWLTQPQRCVGQSQYVVGFARSCSSTGARLLCTCLLARRSTADCKLARERGFQLAFSKLCGQRLLLSVTGYALWEVSCSRPSTTGPSRTLHGLVGRIFDIWVAADNFKQLWAVSHARVVAPASKRLQTIHLQ